jgi:hypothetical protein
MLKTQIKDGVEYLVAGPDPQCGVILMHRHVRNERPNACTARSHDSDNDSLESRFHWYATTRPLYLRFPMLSGWSRQCVNQRETYGQKFSEKIPTRLLDLDAFPLSKGLRLVETKGIKVEAYATLSYRWGRYKSSYIEFRELQTDENTDSASRTTSNHTGSHRDM